jgi:CheY-like chemotaxis protein
MALLALIVSSDSRDVLVLQDILRELHVDSLVCRTAFEARELVAAKPVNAVLLDGDVPEVDEVIQELTRSQRAEPQRIIAVLSASNDSRRAFGVGAHFVLYKPISRDRSLVSLEYAFRTPVKKRRDTSRHNLYLSTTVSSPAVDIDAVTLLNLSPTGTALQTKKRLPPDSKLYFEFQIPEQASTIRLAGNVVWQDIDGRAGVQFASVPAASRRALQQWQDRMEREDTGDDPEIAMEVERFGPMDSPGNRDPQPPPIVVRQNIKVPAQKERRGQSRYRVDAGVRVSDQRSAVPNWCNIVDISRGGCYIEMVMPFPKGTLLTLELRAGAMRLQTRGQVQSSLPGKGMGVQFVIEDQKQRDQISQIVEFLAAGSSLRI